MSRISKLKVETQHREGERIFNDRANAPRETRVFNTLQLNL